MYKVFVNGKHTADCETQIAAMEKLDDIVKNTEALQEVCCFNHNDQSEDMQVCVWKYENSDDLLIITIDKE